MTKMKTEDTWRFIHGERANLATTWESLSAEQWAAASWCEGWTVQEVAGHVLSAAEQTTMNFYKELAGAGFSFDRFAERGAKRLAAIGPAELIRRLKARTTTTNHPPAPVMAMLGEVIVHSDDIRRPLGLSHAAPAAALVALADNWKNSNLLIGAKRRISGVSLRATDVDWSHGAGPEVAGPLQSLILAMVGRKGAHVDLTGAGVAVLATRP
ncbi:MAG: maleylpyruvate isomerase family mycothiol-dependent enzyme [Acidimicrobiales bacterium]